MMYQGTAPVKRCYGVSLPEAHKEVFGMVVLVAVSLLLLVVFHSF